MSFRIRGLSPAPFLPLYGLSENALAAQGARRYIVDKSPGFPDRIELRDGEPGEAVLLLNFRHQPAATPYQASHAIFVREGALQAAEFENAVPEVLRRRVISLRAFGADHYMVDADLASGDEIADLIQRYLSDPAVSYLQAHYARRGCYAARVERT
ncbi:uncharacterized protein DUF1203 [Tahibacter aquaticus]|uniref:Uncharacterized protein DUF1203 n=1 Tax=Tahibacter aquaticus TaxID=520092 RepID=A0A4R6Z0U8_9GAMM|nr:DUF1203 domain-containing protein [Tahibacter aquaticus]TDR45054.1 uncharacterized protein DUF1203 [Tahibacter aquaticus]